MLGDRVYSLTYPASRSLVNGLHGMAASAHPLASLAAIDVLRSGGNAVDAALAGVAVLGVVEPVGCGVGGDLFAIVRFPDGSVFGLNGSGRAPSGRTLSDMHARGYSVSPSYGPDSVTVPGC